MTPIQIKQALAARGMNLSLLAASLNVSKAAVGMTVNRRMTSVSIAQAIAKAINKDFLTVFPDYVEIVPQVRAKIDAHSVENLRKIIG